MGGRIMQGLKLDLSSYDGISLKVLGDGQTFKVNIKTAQDAIPNSSYQATFDTVAGLACLLRCALEPASNLQICAA